MGAFGQTLGLLFEINADPNHAVTALKLFEEQIATSLGVSTKSWQQFKDVSAASAKDLAIIGAAVGAAGVAMIAAADKAADFALEIGHVAERSGATAEEVSTLKFSADRVGVSFDSVTTGLTFLARNLGQIAEGGGKNAKKALDDLGISATDANGRFIPVRDLLPVIVDRLAHMEAGGQRTADAMALFGRGGGALIPVLNSMGAGFKAAAEQAASLGLVITEKDIVAARQFQIAQKTLTAEIAAFTLHVGQKLIPCVTELFIKLEFYPILLEQIALTAAKVAAVAAAFGTAGVSLLALIPISKAAGEAQKQMDQAVTTVLIHLQEETRAATVAGAALGDTGSGGGGAAGGGKPLATGAREATAAVHALAQSIPTITVPITSQLIPPLAQLDTSLKSIQADLAALVPDFKVAGDAAAVYGAVSEDSSDRATKAERRAVEQHAIGLVAAIANRRAAAAVEAIWETANAFACLGDYDYWGAAQHFLSAAEYGVIAGTGGKSGGGSGGTNASSTPGATPPVAAGTSGMLAPGATSPNASGGVTVIFQGPVYGGKSGIQEMAQHLSDAVQNRNVRLVSSHTRNPVTAAH